MPTYRISAPAELLTPAKRLALAEVVTACHSRITFAPRYYVQVLFEPRSAGDQYISGSIPNVPQVFVSGVIRAGRTDAQKASLLVDMVEGIAAALKVEKRQMWFYLSELPANQMAEFGEELPVAGAEAAWFAALSPEQQRYMTDMDSD
jgi:phenylpyruvate tautomerase PptA (4-oxalocrotonate tautomerase family)